MDGLGKEERKINKFYGIAKRRIIFSISKNCWQITPPYSLNYKIYDKFRHRYYAAS
jgi:hypothetical protein